LAEVFVSRRGFEPLGFRNLSDWSRERIGVGARSVREWARVTRALAPLPRLRQAVELGEVSWTVARRIVSLVTPENEEACLATVRGRTVRAVDELLRAVGASDEGAPERDDRVAVRVRCSPAVATKWAAALELARRVSGESLAAWECAEAVAAECASAIPLDDLSAASPAPAQPPKRRRDDSESGLRAAAWEHLDWRARRTRVDDRLACLSRGIDDCSPRTLDRRFRAAIAFLQESDFEVGRVLKQVVNRTLYREIGFASFDRYVEERLDLSPRTARRLVRLARAEHTAPPVASAFREGRITLLQAELLLRGGDVKRAVQVTLRRLQDQTPEPVVFHAPPEVAGLFTGLVARIGLEAMLDHAIETWLQAGRRFRDYADFERDGWRCTVPGCSARRNLQSHHIRYRSAGGPDESWNRTTLCAFHHQRGVHAGTVSIRGRAPDDLVYDLAIGRFRSGDVRC